MRGTAAQVRSFNRPIQLLMINQLTINVGFYMLMPYLAGYLTGDLGLTALLAGLILGVRNLSQQGMFLVGGSLADRIGYKPMIITGLVLRTVGFGLLGVVEGVPALILASALTGLAGAFFNPAARAYLAQEAGERTVDAFAVFNIFYQTGIVVGPLLGLLLNGLAFRVTCLAAAGVFAVLAVAQVRTLPVRRGSRADAKESMLSDWRHVLGDQSFLLFSLAMIGSYVLSFQIYLGLPIQVRQATGGELGVTLLFVLSGVIAMLGQVRVTTWVKARWTAEQAMSRGLGLMALAFLPLVLNIPSGWAALLPVLLTTTLLTLGTLIVYPFEMATIAALGDRMTGTYYGLYNTLSGLGIALGNLLTGAVIDLGNRVGLFWLPWWSLVLIGIGCALAVHRLGRTGRLRSRSPELINVPSGR